MKPHLYLFILLLFLCIKTSAQQSFTISGTVKDSIGAPQKAATVFLSGTQRITISDDKGEFSFAGMTAGTYQLSVSMVGFAPFAQNVVVQYASDKVNVVLKGKTVVLHEVVIGPDRRQQNMNLFRIAFLGLTENAKQCVFLNPDVINFNYDKKTRILTADADEFLLIENKNLGYRVKYLLKDFSYNINYDVALYDGETSFEELPGATRQKRIWAKNREDAYNGSMMQFLRSVYQLNTTQQGYALYDLFREEGSSYAAKKGRLIVDDTAVMPGALLTPVDSALKAMKFRILYIDYVGTKKPKLTGKDAGLPHKIDIEAGKNSSVLRLLVPQAVIDARGSYSDYKSFYLHGFMATKRVGDQLPFEYQPTAK